MTQAPVPSFWDTEIESGRQLGRGSFCTVTEVTTIKLASDDKPLPTATKQGDGSSSSPEAATNNPNSKQDSLRSLLANKFKQASKRAPFRDASLAIYGKPKGPPLEMDNPEEEPAPQIAMKQIQSALSEGTLKIAREDFHRELDILLELSSSESTVHPNIIELYGIGYQNDQESDDAAIPRQPSFLLLHRLRSTLTQRIRRWRDENTTSSMLRVFSWDLTRRQNQWIERLLVLSKVAHALNHLHSHHILFRDTKPDNVGFDSMDIPKLFDFGLARKIDPVAMKPATADSSDDEDDEGLFRLTAMTGTLRYMAIEVGKGRPYGWTADVYSLGILMHEVLSLKVPFGGIRPKQLPQVVWNEGQRPPMDISWPEMLQTLIPQMWHSDPTQRPQMKDVAQMLDGTLRGTDQGLFPKSILPTGRIRPPWGHG
eukprot:Nitzschia sp. Nitz4//scaffold10_size219509//169952//171232//NITZ4_001451-RA/size219509-processed-gene-0.288-mRNA-1//1//CDS//3329532989//1504//frame0